MNGPLSGHYRAVNRRAPWSGFEQFSTEMNVEFTSATLCIRSRIPRIGPLSIIEKRLQDQRGRNLVDDSTVLLPFAAGLIKQLLCLAGGQALVPEVNGEAA